MSAHRSSILATLRLRWGMGSMRRVHWHQRQIKSAEWTVQELRALYNAGINIPWSAIGIVERKAKRLHGSLYHWDTRARQLAMEIARLETQVALERCRPESDAERLIFQFNKSEKRGNA